MNSIKLAQDVLRGMRCERGKSQEERILKKLEELKLSSFCRNLERRSIINGNVS